MYIDHTEWIRLSKGAWERARLIECRLVGSKDGGEDEGKCREDGFWGELEVELELGGEVV